MDTKIFVYDNTVSARTYISYIAEQAGGFACIGRDGKLYIKTIGSNITELPIKYFKTFKLGENFQISRVKYEDGIQLFEIGNETNNTLYINQENMYIVNQEQIDNIYAQVNGLEAYSFEGESIIDPALDIGDLLLIDGKYVIYQGTIKYSGKWQASIESSIQCKSKEETMSNTYSNIQSIRRLQSRINQAEGTITQLSKETSENEERLSQTIQTVDSISSKISSDDGITQKVNELSEKVDGITNQISTAGGNNIFYYSKEFWHGKTDEDDANLLEYTDTEVQQKSVSSTGYMVNQGISRQVVQVKNDNYTISFTYKKLKELANGYILFNGDKYDLTQTDWTEVILTSSIDTSTIDFEIISDSEEAFEIYDLMGNVGIDKLIWTQNPNETRTDTVKIGKGIEIQSDTKNTYARFDADGNRIFNNSTNEIVTELTDKGIETADIRADTIQTGGILIQDIDNQTWISSIL